MKIYCVLMVLAFAFAATNAQGQTERLTGVVLEQADDGTFHPIIGANVYWLGTGSGTTTDTVGMFRLPIITATRRLVVTHIGFLADTLVIVEQRQVKVILKSAETNIAEVQVVGVQSPTYLKYLSTENTKVMSEKELFKAACCNLSESFETNPSIDVSFTDAITGTKQIEMLGLAGTYTQITLENLPAIRGLTSSVGLTYIPGTWVESIQVSKGVGSVANGYESITGQINVELRKPPAVEEKLLFLNLFTNNDLRVEGNLNLRTGLSDEWSSMTMLHASTQRLPVDGNRDNFLDMPLTRTVNAIQRFHYTNHAGWEGQLGVQFVDDGKEGGTKQGYYLDRPALALQPAEYAFTMNGRQLRVWGKTGYVFPQKQYQSIGVQWALTNNRQNASFSSHEYDANEESGYMNLIYQSIIGTTAHKVRTGLSFLYDAYDETFNQVRYRRIERVPGVFVEYTYTPGDEFSVIAGLRADDNSLYGSFVTPRLHFRYAPDADWVFRGAAGRGQRTANVFVENMAYFASARHVMGVRSNTQGAYGLGPEVAWNYGLNMTHYFLWDYREATLSVDVYRTEFKQQIVVDLDANPQEVRFYNLNGTSYSNSVQAEVNVRPIENLDTRLAYRFLDVDQTINGTVRERPFVARHRAFLNLSYAGERNEETNVGMVYDVTLQWFGQKRLPDTQSNPSGLQRQGSSRDFILANAQITRTFVAGFDVYLGVENLLNFTQQDPILDSANPNGSYFDSSLIWGPVYGRTAYIGLRWRM